MKFIKVRGSKLGHFEDKAFYLNVEYIASIEALEDRLVIRTIAEDEVVVKKYSEGFEEVVNFIAEAINGLPRSSI